mgnify:FL=1
MEICIRDISEQGQDIDRCLEIYNYYIENTTITFEEEKLKRQAFAERIARIRKGYPFLVAEVEGKVAGYVYLDKYHERSAYRYTADLSIYLDKEVSGCGIGGMLLEEIEKRAAQAGIRNIISLITQENERSVHFHEKHGYVKKGELEQVGLKFGRWLNVLFYQKKVENCKNV